MHSSSPQAPVPEDARADAGGGIAAEISNRLVSLLKKYSGRGPTKARTFLHERMVICVFENALTRGEQQMAEHGEAGQAVESRRSYQRMIRAEAKVAVEELTGRSVIAFLSDNSLEPDIGIEAFVLDSSPAAPEGSPESDVPSR